MSKNRLVSVGSGLLVAAASLSSAMGSTISVTGYNWNQLPLGAAVTPSSTPGGNSLGTPLDFRVGDPQWAPSDTATVNGTADYYAQITFNQLRNVQNVTLDFWAGNPPALSKYTVQGSTDGTTFTDISALTTLTPTATADHRIVNPTITSPGNYLAVRMLVKAGDYTHDNTNHRSPGLEGFDIRGDGSVSSTEVNWANQPSFTTVATSRGFAGQGTGLRFTDGNLYDDESVRTGRFDGHWTTQIASPTNYDYAQVDLTTARTVNKVVLVWDSSHRADTTTAALGGKGVDFLYSTDGTTWLTLSQVGSPTFTGGAGGYASYTITQTDLRYIRVTDATGSDGLQLLNQFMVFGDLVAPVPEPTSVGMLAVGGLFLMRRHRKGSSASAR